MKKDAEKMYDALYEDRLLVFLERKDGFRQVILTPTQFKKVSDAIIVTQSVPSEKGDQEVEINLDDERTIPTALFEGMSSHL